MMLAVNSRALIWLLCGLISGCACFQPKEDPRIAQKCTSISNVVGKNYQLSARFNYLLVGAGLNFERSGMRLSAEATERQMDLDRLCRLWAANGLSDDKWAEAYTQHIIASSVAISRANNPEAKRELDENLEELRGLLHELSGLKPDSRAVKDVPSFSVLKEAVEIARQQADKDISAKLNAVSEALGSKFMAGNVSITEQYKLGMRKQETQQAQLLGIMAAMQLRLDTMEQLLTGPKLPRNDQQAQDNPKSLPRGPKVWQQTPVFRVNFGHGAVRLSDNARATLLANLAELSNAEDYRVELFGYTDTSGNPSTHATLSLARAEEVRDYLVDEPKLKLDPTKLFPQGRQRGVEKFGDAPENRAVEVRARKLVEAPAATNAPSSK